MSKEIRSFSGQYRFLSNFWPSPVILDGHSYRTVEHAYQASKTLSHTWRGIIRAAATPGDAKRLGYQLSVRLDYFADPNRKIVTMRSLLRQKFATEPLRGQLLATGKAHLTEGNDWGDTYWGVFKGSGSNHLGRLLMEIRDELR